MGPICSDTTRRSVPASMPTWCRVRTTWTPTRRTGRAWRPWWSRPTACPWRCPATGAWRWLTPAGAGSPVGCWTSPRSPAGCWSGRVWSSSRRATSAPAATPSSSSPIAATAPAPAASAGSLGWSATQAAKRREARPMAVEPFTGLDPRRIRANLDRVRETAGTQVEILAATKYVLPDDMGALAEAGVKLVGENTLQDLEAKRERWGDAFSWDFIGNLQSRKLKRILPLVRLIHSVATDSVLEQLGGHAGPETAVLVEVNLAGEESKGGIEPAYLGDFIDRCAARVQG